MSWGTIGLVLLVLESILKLFKVELLEILMVWLNWHLRRVAKVLVHGALVLLTGREAPHFEILEASILLTGFVKHVMLQEILLIGTTW
mgnify:CR=1 FL=1